MDDKDKRQQGWVKPENVLRARKFKIRKRPFDDQFPKNHKEVGAVQVHIKNVFATFHSNQKSVKIDDEPTVDVKQQEWHEELCLDWSLKAQLRISTKQNFAWSSNNLKSSEESSGISAFVRCVDIEPLSTSKQNQQLHSPKLDTSLGAQFHQCCLYWQHPCLPAVTLFPREAPNNHHKTSFTSALFSISNNNLSSSGSSVSSSPPMRFDERVLDCMQLEWIDALRSSFQLLRVRQTPYFYVCSNTFTCLFCSAGTRDQQIQIYVTPSTKGFRESLKKEGIQFTMPFYNEDKDDSLSSNSSEDGLKIKKPKLFSDVENDNKAEEKDESDDEPDKWLDNMGISQDVSLSSTKFLQNESTLEQKLKSSLLVITGMDALPFFNFLINSRNMLVTSSGPLAGIPPTILSPVAFHGASLRSLKVKQSKVRNDKGEVIHSIEMKGPILPHMMHMLCNLLSKTVSEYKIHVGTLHSTIPLNVHSDSNSNILPPGHRLDKPNAFELQNLSDCGLSKSTLEIFCKCNNCSTIKDVLYRKNCLFHWR